MDDISLTHIEGNTYDWTFDAGDVEIARGDSALVNSVIHSVLLKKEELLQEVYQDKGCEAHEMIQSTASQSNKVFIEEKIIATCKEITGVADATCSISFDEGFAITELSIIKNDGEEVSINEF